MNGFFVRYMVRKYYLPHIIILIYYVIYIIFYLEEPVIQNWSDYIFLEFVALNFFFIMSDSSGGCELSLPYPKTALLPPSSFVLLLSDNILVKC